MNEIQNIKNSGVFPTFFTKAVQVKSDKGIPDFREVDYVKIQISGDNKTIIEKKVTDEEKNRWPTLYEAFKRTGETPIEGLPVEQWPLLSVSQVEKLKFISVRTVQQLVELDDNGLQAYGMGARELQAQAKAFLKASSGDYASIASRINQLEIDNEALKQQIKDQDAIISKLKKK